MWIYGAITLSIVLLGVLTVVYLYIRRQFLYWERRNVPFLQPHFFYGSFGDFVTGKESLAQVMSEVYDGFKGKQFGGVWEFFRPKLFVVDPNLLRQMFVKDFGTWPDRGVTVNTDTNPLGENLANLDGKKWRVVRTKLTPTFTSAKLKQMYRLLSECIENFEKYLDVVAESGKPVEVKEINAKLSTDVLGSCAFGIQMHSLNDENALFRRMGKKIFEMSPQKAITEMLLNGFPWLYKLLKLASVPQDFTKFFLAVIEETFQYREINNIQRHDFMDVLRSMRNTGESLGEDEMDFNVKFLTAQAFVIFSAGFETTSSTVSYCLHELAVNEDIQDRLREEVHRIKAENEGEISWDGLKNMKYLDMVIQETLRKYPIVLSIERKSVKPYRIPDTNVELPTGTISVIPIYGLHHDPEYYPDPKKFDPDRFTEEAKSQRPASAYIPFGVGPRVCIGMRFADLQMRMALAKIMDKYKISLCEKSQNPLRYVPRDRLLSPEIGIWLTISKNISNQNPSSTD